MQASFEYRLSRDEYAVGVQMLTREIAQQDSGSTRRVFEMLGVILIAFLFVTYFFPEAFGGILVASFLVGVAEMAMRRRWLRSVSGRSYDPAAADLRVEVNDDGIGEFAVGRSTHWDWRAIRRIHDPGPALVLEAVGWNMVILPSRLWADGEDRARFVEELRARLPEQADAEAPATPSPPLGLRETLVMASIAGALDLIFLATYFLPLLMLRFGPLKGFAFVVGFGLFLIVSLAAGYLLYRLVHAGLHRLHAQSPNAAALLAQLLIWAIPFYLVAAYFGLLQGGS